MPAAIDHRLIVAISSRALFDLSESHAVYERDGVEAYQRHQVAHENDLLQPGVAFELTRKLLRLNEGGGEHVEVVLLSRNGRDLGRYFPELIEAVRSELAPRCVLDGEIVVPREVDGRTRLDWDSLSQRIHPAASRVNMLAEQTPAHFIGFDALAVGDTSLMGEPFRPPGDPNVEEPIAAFVRPGDESLITIIGRTLRDAPPSLADFDRGLHPLRPEVPA
mgnify:CR=1 FL=1